MMVRQIAAFALLGAGCTQGAEPGPPPQALAELAADNERLADEVTVLGSQLESLRTDLEAEHARISDLQATVEQLRQPVAPTAGDESATALAELATKAASSIKCTGHNCTMERPFIEQMLANPSALARQARIVPALKDGEAIGFKMYGIRPGSLPKLLGFANGDMLVKANGLSLHSVDAAMAAYSKLRTAKTVELEVVRKGEPLTKKIKIVDGL